MTDQTRHTFWQRRVIKEDENRKRYYQRAYKDGFGKNGPWKALEDNIENDSGLGELYVPPSYPIPHTRTGLEQQRLKRMPFMTDSSATKPSDPSSL